MRCVRSVRSLNYSSYRVLVVDNGSTDDSVSRIREAFPDVEILALDENYGYADGNNIGVIHALQEGATHLLILNNDTTVAPNMLEILMNFMQTNPNVGIVGPKVLCMDKPELLASAGNRVDWWRAKAINRGMFETDAGSYEKPEKVDYLVGCGLLISAACWQAIGGFNPSYYLNYEDVELGVRAGRMGYAVWYVPQAKMWHKVNATLGYGSPANTYYMTRNALLFFWRNAPLQWKVPAVLRILGRTLRTVAAWTVKSQYHSDTYRRKRAANLYAIRDFFLARLGRMGEDVAKVCYG